MRFSLCRAALAACLVSLCPLASAWGQQAPPAATRPAAPAATAAGTNVAVIDIALIFKHHDRFNAAMGDIKKDIEQFEAYVRDEQRKLKTRVEELQEFTATSPEYKTKEGELARTQSELQVQIGLKRKDFLEQEARVYYRVYQEIEQSVAVFAQRYRIGLVLRFNSDKMEENDRASVLQGVNKAVVYNNGLEITKPIIEDLNRRPFNPKDAEDKPGTPTATSPGPAPGPIARPPVVPGRTTVPR